MKRILAMIMAAILTFGCAIAERPAATASPEQISARKLDYYEDGEPEGAAGVPRRMNIAVPAPTPKPMELAMKLPEFKPVVTPEPTPSVSDKLYNARGEILTIGFKDIQRGDEGDVVKELQKVLIGLNYLAVGEDDGIYGPATARAVHNYRIYRDKQNAEGTLASILVPHTLGCKDPEWCSIDYLYMSPVSDEKYSGTPISSKKQSGSSSSSKKNSSSGRKRYDCVRRCSYCGGDGMTYYGTKKKTCVVCYGSGICQTCHGQGWHY